MLRFHHTDPTYPAFSIFACLGFVLPLIPLSWHMQAWNSGTCWYIFWSSLSCLNLFVNSLVWAGNTLNVAPAWCEISIRIIMGASVGLPAASLCINRRLYNIAIVRSVVVTKAEKRRTVLIDSMICGVFPAVFVGAQYIVQGHRFNIFEDIGCYPAIFNTLPAYFISAMWPVIIGLVSAVYCVLSLRAFSQRRAAFNQFLSAHNALTPSRYLRLSALASMDLMLTVPLASLAIYINATASPVSPWVSWASAHFDFGRVEEIPRIIWAADRGTRMGIELTRWLSPMCSMVFFAFFGFAAEARKHYADAYHAVADKFWAAGGLLGLQRPSSGFFAKHSTPSPSHCRFGEPKIKAKPTPLALSLPIQFGVGIASMTDSVSLSTTSRSSVADLKRANSLASSFPGQREDTTFDHFPDVGSPSTATTFVVTPGQASSLPVERPSQPHSPVFSVHSCSTLHSGRTEVSGYNASYLTYPQCGRTHV
ncbi:unnamed protein product [Mycena citricolor]|uniref:Pheromone receptor n=1 Tax=Mycena citricolor TaxID=2018698 RepID=A0AAD2H706_9AGAR|nr:unnamed protein product [Mycena citricolor]